MSAERFRGLVAGTAILICGFAHAGLSAQTTDALPTETSLKASASNDGHGTAATLEIRVDPRAGGETPTGVVSLVDRQSDGTERAIGSAVLNTDGTATVVTTNIAAGDHGLRAVYGGDASHAPSASAVTSLHADATGVPSFTLSLAPSSLNLVAGTFGNSILTLTPVNGFTGYVTVSCSGLPLGATCIFTPTNVYVGSTAGRATITIQTTGPSGRSQLESGNHGLVYALLLPGILCLAGMGTRRSGLRNLTLVLLVGSVAVGLSSCSDRYRYFHNPPVKTIGTPPGTSSITIEATAVNGSQVTTQTIPIALTVTASSGS